jgi:hypothetical protein
MIFNYVIKINEVETIIDNNSSPDPLKGQELTRAWRIPSPKNLTYDLENQKGSRL